MKLIKIIIIAIFLFSGFLAYLLFQQKSKRIDTQLSKKEVGWNPIAIKKIVISRQHKDTLVLTKKSGVWKSNKQFDALGIAPQLLVYLSTMQIDTILPGPDPNLFTNAVSIITFDKNEAVINELMVGKTLAPGSNIAKLNNSDHLVSLSNQMNKESLRDLLDKIVH